MPENVCGVAVDVLCDARNVGDSEETVEHGEEGIGWRQRCGRDEGVRLSRHAWLKWIYAGPHIRPRIAQFSKL